TSTHGYDQSKTVVSQNVHLPFGQRSYAYGNSPYHEFTGKPWDAESQMYYFPYRYYSPNMNRWTSPDPAGLVDGPNIYIYVLNNSINSVDLLGLKRCCEFTVKDLYSCLQCAYQSTRASIYCPLCKYNIGICISVTESGPWVALCLFSAGYFCLRCAYHSFKVIKHCKRCAEAIYNLANCHVSN
ncbi:MAG: RHS repeat-associated core domain-containing protein, partial [Candidatus Hydrogenedentes bacterium]|nr:RHS repeat-associated core domain-containing protein [Candidatus Hydrogenedentota bacterium]